MNDTNEALALAAGPYVTSLRMPPELLPLVRSTLLDVLVADDQPTPFVSSVELEPDGTYRIRADGRTFRRHLEADWVPDHLVRMLLLAELDAHPERLHLHAGAVAVDGRGVVIAGFSGHGKSTLTTALVRDGFDYLTDERVAIDSDSLIVSGFPKPISLVKGSFAVYPELNPEVLGHGKGTDTEWQVPASVIGSGTTITEMRARVIVFVKYQAGSDVTVERVHPVTAVARLLHDSPDIARFGAQALRVGAALCTSALCVELTYSRPTDAGSAVRALLDEADRTIPNHDVEFFGADSSIAADEQRARQVAGTDRLARIAAHAMVVVDGRALMHLDDTQELVELDESATAWLMLVDGVSTVDQLIDAVHEETGIDRTDLSAGAIRALARLASRGFLTAVS